MSVILAHVTATAEENRQERAVIYVRESLDKWGDARAVERFEDECRRLCGRRGLRIVRVLRDNDVRASKGNKGRGYAETLRMMRARETDYVVVPVVDRFVRNLRDLEDIIDICEQTGVVVLATSGDIDLSHDQGRLVGRILASVAKGEVERKGKRQKDAAAQGARKGERFVGGNRPFGYEDDHVTVRPAEAEAIRWAVNALLGGGAVSGMRREWNRRGLRPPQAPYGPLLEHPWTRQAVTSILRNPRIAGLAVMPQREDPNDRPELDNPPRTRKRLLPPEIVGTGNWEEIITEEQWRAVTALLGDPARKPPRGAYTLGGGLFTCRCGNKVAAGTNATGKQVYRCDPAIRGDQPGPHCQQMTANVDPYVEAVIVERLSRADVAELVMPSASAVVDTAGLHREAAAIRRNLETYAKDAALNRIDRVEYLAMRDAGHARLAEITADLAESVAGSALAPFAAAESADAVWKDLDTARKRAVIDALTPVIIHPAGRGARSFDPATVVMPWQHDQR